MEEIRRCRGSAGSRLHQRNARRLRNHYWRKRTTLSGGQRQRLALARAFLTDPASLSSMIQPVRLTVKLRTKFNVPPRKPSEGRTTFIITHRLSQIRWADLIIVVRKGKISAIGNHEELMKTSKAYQDIFREV